MANNPVTGNPFQLSNFALWGPSGVGKNWLIMGFIKELEYYNRLDNNYVYEVYENNIGENNPIPLNGDPPLNIIPTNGVEDFSYIFQRIPLRPESNSPSNEIRHNIIIHNDRGDDLVNCLIDPDYSDFRSKYQMLINSKNLILVLGIPAEEKRKDSISEKIMNEDEEGEEGNILETVNNYARLQKLGNYETHFEPSSDIEWTNSTYHRFLRLLFSAIEETPNHNIAICMTKSDLSNYRGDPWEILQRRYTADLRRLIELNRRRHNIEVFITSAAGYMRKGNKNSPNFHNGALADPSRWNPINTAAPFFWIFDKTEREIFQRRNPRLIDLNRPKYIPYPQPRPY